MSLSPLISMPEAQFTAERTQGALFSSSTRLTSEADVGTRRTNSDWNRFDAMETAAVGRAEASDTGRDDSSSEVVGLNEAGARRP